MEKLAVDSGKPVRTKPFPLWPVYDEGEKKALCEVLESRKWGCHVGTKVTEFEKKFAEYQGAEYGICVVNGTAALEVALRAAGIGPGDEVIVPPYTFIATATAVLLVNAIPVFVDIDPQTYCLDPSKIEEVITEKTRAVMPVHIGGSPCDMDKIIEIAQRHKLKVIEDACQAHGAEWKGRKVGAIGDAGCFSFQASKNMSSGEGGIIITNNKELARMCWSLHTCGRREDGAWYEHPYLGWNYRMPEFEAGILLVQLERLEQHTELRNKNASYLSRELSRIDGITPVKLTEGVTRSSCHIYMFRYNQDKFNGFSRNRFVEALQAEGIPCGQGYVPLYKEKLFGEVIKKCPLSCHHYGKDIDYSRVKCPVAERASYEEGVWIPQNVLLGTEKDIDDIILAINKIKEEKPA